MSPSESFTDFRAPTELAIKPVRNQPVAVVVEVEIARGDYFARFEANGKLIWKIWQIRNEFKT
jgi:hypothetical protein